MDNLTPPPPPPANYPPLPPPIGAPIQQGGSNKKWIFWGCGGCLGLLLIGGIAAFFIFKGVLGLLEKSPPYQDGIAKAQSSAEVKAALGDLRLSIGNFKGTPTAVIFRPVAAKTKTRSPKTFSSGVIKEYVVADVTVLTGAQLKFTKRNDGYVIEAVIPLAALEFTPAAGQTLDEVGNTTVRSTHLDRS